MRYRCLPFVRPLITESIWSALSIVVLREVEPDHDRPVVEELESDADLLEYVGVHERKRVPDVVDNGNLGEGLERCARGRYVGLGKALQSFALFGGENDRVARVRCVVATRGER